MFKKGGGNLFAVLFCLPDDHASNPPSLCFGLCLVKSHPPSLSLFSSPLLISLWCIYTLATLSCSVSSPYSIPPLCLPLWGFQRSILMNLPVLPPSKRQLWGVLKSYDVPVVNIKSRNHLYFVYYSVLNYIYGYILHYLTEEHNMHDSQLSIAIFNTFLRLCCDSRVKYFCVLFFFFF